MKGGRWTVAGQDQSATGRVLTESRMRSVRLSVVDWELIKLALDDLGLESGDQDVIRACVEIITAIRNQTR